MHPGSNAESGEMPGQVVCTLCPHRCALREGKTGICSVRSVREGRIVSLNYGKATSLALDPIEKKPLAMFHPGSNILSYGSYGCNLRCPFCQNSDIAMAKNDCEVPTRYIPPETLVAEALALRKQGNIGIAFTYNEPFIAREYLVDVARLAHKEGLLVVAVTNGYVTSEAWIDTLPFIDALNIDLKCFSDEGYRSLNAPHGLATVQKSIASAFEAGRHVEVTTLIVPGLSDNQEEFEEEVVWLASMSPDIPLHLSRFFPNYKRRDADPTDIALMRRFRMIAQESLNHVFLGNVV